MRETAILDEWLFLLLLFWAELSWERERERKYDKHKLYSYVYQKNTIYTEFKLIRRMYDLDLDFFSFVLSFSFLFCSPLWRWFLSLFNVVYKHTRFDTWINFMFVVHFHFFFSSLYNNCHCLLSRLLSLLLWFCVRVFGFVFWFRLFFVNGSSKTITCHCSRNAHKKNTKWTFL